MRTKTGLGLWIAAGVLAAASVAAQAAPLVNVGLGGKDTSASPQNWGGAPGNAVDGNLGTWVHSAAAGTNFWEIDLGGTIPITRYTAYARPGYLGRIDGATISFLDHADAVVGSRTLHVGPRTSESVPFVVPVEARKVRIGKTSDYLNFVELELYAENFALGAATSQSSVYSGYNPNGAEATDGNLGSETHTATGDPLPTLMVDLGKPNVAVDSIILHNRDSCCQGRLSDLVVEVLDSTMAVVQSAVVNPGDSLGGPPTLGVDLHELFGSPAAGQYVRVSKTADSGAGMWLALGEVQVFGQDADSPPPTQLGFQNPTAYRSQAGLEVGFAVDGAVGSGFGTGWGDNAGPDDNTAVFETTADIDVGDETMLTLTLDHQSFTGHAIGKFRISATAADRSQFADGQANNGQLGAPGIWTPVQVIDAEASGGSLFEVQPDGSVLVSGPNPGSDVYTVRALTDLRGITGIRLEALQDPALPNLGPGRPSSGNFVLTELEAWAQQTPDVLPVGLQNPTADKSQPGWSVHNILTDNTTGWAAITSGSTATPQTAAVETMGDVGFDDGTTLTFNLAHLAAPDQGIGKFRLSVTTADRDQFADGLDNGGDLGDPAIWTDLVPLSMVSSAGASITINPDHTILVGGSNAGPDTYTVVANTSLTGITGIRLETLEDPSLPANGPGRSPRGIPGGNGNYILTQFAAAETPLGVQAVNIAQAAPVEVVGGSSYNSPQLINDGVITDSVGSSAFMIPPRAPQGLGYDLGGFATVDSLRIYQHSAAGGGGTRRRLESLTVYTTAGPMTFSDLPDQDVLDLDLGGVKTAYVFIRPGSQHAGAPDPQLGIREIEVYTTGLGIIPRPNVALGKPATVVGSGWGYGSASDLTDGILTWGPGLDNTGTAIYNNQLSPTNGWIDIDLGQALSVDTLGIVQQTLGGPAGTTTRKMIQDIELIFSNDAFATILDTQTVTLMDGVAYQQVGFDWIDAQYVRINPLSQYGTGQDPRIGIVEVQLFLIPEPATLSLLGLGALALLARRRRRR